MDWPPGWSAIIKSEVRAAIARELESELGEGHVLKGAACMPIARAEGSDDILFQLDDGRVAEVHLTFAGRPERPPWPGTAIFDDLNAWAKAVEEQ